MIESQPMLKILIGLLCSLLFVSGAHAQPPQRITVIYDAFGAPSPLERDWGYAALIEYGGRRILFDTGNDAEIFARNVKQLNVDLSRLDAVVISHRHGDHTSGIAHVLEANPGVTIYAPQEGAFFNSRTPESFLERHPGLPQELQYFGGRAPTKWQSGSPWPAARFQIVTGPTEIFPGFFVLTTRSKKPGTVEMNELSLAIRTPRGFAVVVGCSHPGVETILESVATLDRRIYTVTGGFHLVTNPLAEVERVASVLHDTLKVERVAPGHCTSERGFAEFLRRFGDRFDRAGVGAVLTLP
jgi:7,8-dihydropterin-6-yl-methyl-4-(beta-D-ribofuranosyl)aminobenzene 5'-phosphate synthase